MNYARYTYEPNDTAFPANAYRVSGHPGIAWYVLGWETETVIRESWEKCDTCQGDGFTIDDDDQQETCQDCRGHGAFDTTDYEPEPERTGNLVCVMVGDDRHWSFDPDDVAPLDDDDYCHECGQIGCGHDGRDRSATT